MHYNPVSQRRNDALLRHTKGKEMSAYRYSQRRSTRTLLVSRSVLQRHHLANNRHDLETDRTRQRQLGLVPCLFWLRSRLETIMALSHHGWPAPKSLPSPRFLFPCAGHAGRDAMFQPSRGLVLAAFDSVLALTSGSLQAFPSLQPLFVAVDTTNAYASKSIHLSCCNFCSKLRPKSSSKPHRAMLQR